MAQHDVVMLRSTRYAGRGLPAAATASFMGLALLLAGASGASAQVADDSAFHTSPLNASGISAKRTQMINFIWGSAGFPTTKMPATHKFVPSPVAGLTNLQSVEALRVTMDAGQYAIGYHFLPAANRRNQLVIVHDGHMACYLDDGPTTTQKDAGIQRTIKALLADGFGVLAITMPQYTPADPNLPDPGNCAQNHIGMFNLPVSGGNPLKFFMEPVAAGINYLVSTVKYPTINMLGLSGGGWTTTLYAALDTRIATSMPVAGTLPLYMIPSNQSPDLEQYLPAFYNPSGASPSGIAGYLDIYLLGSRGTGRRQVQILNRHDDCCYGERFTVPSIGFEAGIRTYESRLKSVAPGVAGLFRTVIDEVSPYHEISDNAIQNVILPVLRNPAVASTLNTTIRSRYGSAGNLCLDIPALGRAPQNGDAVQVYQCGGGSNQEFSIQSDGTIRLPQWGGFCLDVPDLGRPPQNGDLMQIYTCGGGLNQQFDLQSDGTIRNRWNGLCLDIPGLGREPQNGDRLQVYQCGGGSNQAFSVNKPTTTISSVWDSSLCFDVPSVGRPPQSGDLMQVYSCNGGQNQRFNLQADATFRTEWGGLCLTVPNLGRPPANGDRLQLSACNVSLNQQFDIVADGTLRSRTQGALCLDIPDVGRPPQSGDALQLYQCAAGPNQRFNINR